MNKLIPMLFMVLLIQSCDQSTDEKTGTVYVKNNSVFLQIRTINIDPSDKVDWSDNKIQGKLLGTTETISFTGLTPCDTHWDLRAIYTDNQIRKLIKVWLSCGGSVSWDVN